MQVKGIAIDVKISRQYEIKQKKLNSTIEKLSSGYRINFAKDDAANLAISTRLNVRTKSITQAIKNVQDGVSLVQTAENAIESIEQMLQRARTLSVQAANQTLTQEDRSLIQTEIDNLTAEINRIANSVSFNGVPLLNGYIEWYERENDSNKVIVYDVGIIGTPEYGIYKVRLDRAGTKDETKLIATTSTHINLANISSYEKVTSYEKPNNNGVVNFHSATANPTNTNIGVIDKVEDSSGNILSQATNEYSWNAATGNLTVNNTSGDGIVQKTSVAGGAKTGSWQIQIAETGYSVVAADAANIIIIDPAATKTGVTNGNGMTQTGSTAIKSDVTNVSATGANSITLSYAGTHISSYNIDKFVMVDIDKTTNNNLENAGSGGFYLDPTAADGWSTSAVGGGGFYIADGGDKYSQGSVGDVTLNGVLIADGWTEIAWGAAYSNPGVSKEIKINYATGQVETNNLALPAGAAITYKAGYNFTGNIASQNTTTGVITLNGSQGINPNSGLGTLEVQYDATYYNQFNLAKPNSDGVNPVNGAGATINNATGTVSNAGVVSLTDISTGTVSVDYSYRRKYSTGNGDSFSFNGDKITITNGTGDSVSDPADNVSNLEMTYKYYDGIRLTYYELPQTPLSNTIKVSTGSGSAFKNIASTTEENDTYEVSGRGVRINGFDGTAAIEFSYDSDTPVTITGLTQQLGEAVPVVGGDSTNNGTTSVFNDFWTPANLSLTVDNNVFNITINPTDTIQDVIDKLNNEANTQRTGGSTASTAFLTASGGSNAAFTASWDGSTILLTSDYKGSRFNITANNIFGNDLEHLFRFNSGISGTPAVDPQVTVTDANNNTYQTTATSNFINNTSSINGISGVRIQLKEELTSADVGDESILEILSISLQDSPDKTNNTVIGIALRDMQADALGVGNIDVTTISGAAQAISLYDTAINEVSEHRATLGATLARMESRLNFLMEEYIETSQTNSRIIDTDYAYQTMEMVKNQIQNESTKFTLKEANIMYENMLNLIYNHLNI
ncbi:MAG TPA: flagellin [bacterium]|nr:flagellin [bacterium]HOL48853.1 flagellin [bacterium]HPQ20079.1 flagellin [bacterium]